MSQTAASRAATAVPRFETPFLRAGVSTPGLPVLPPNVERHPVPGGGSRAVEIEAGDVISIMDGRLGCSGAHRPESQRL